MPGSRTILVVDRSALAGNTTSDMNIFEQMAAQDHEQVIAFQNRATGLRGFLAIHDTTLGPALGAGDLGSIARPTRDVAREPSPELGDISEHTALGVWHGMRACLEFARLKKARVAVQGVGSVGMWLARILKGEGMELVVADLDP